MEKGTLPNKILCEINKENKNEAKIIIEPCMPGYGITWGNALRRVLLSSLPGAAVDSVRIKGVKYEFSSIPYVKEDVLDIILNLKLLKAKILSSNDGPIKLSLEANGDKKVYARDIAKNSEVEIINPDLLIATLTDKKARLEMDIWIKRGFGWVPSEEKSREEMEVGTIAMDSNFSPILNVALNVENVRVGKRTDYDKLILTIKTNGVISPTDAFLSATKLLSNQFKFLEETSQKNFIKIAAKKNRSNILKSEKSKKVKKVKKIKKVKKTKKSKK